MKNYIFILKLLLIPVFSSKVNVLIDDIGQLTTNNNKRSESFMLNNDYIQDRIVEEFNNIQFVKKNMDVSDDLNQYINKHEFICQCKISNNCISYKECYGLAIGMAIIILLLIISVGFLLQYLSLVPYQYLSDDEYIKDRNKEIKRCCFKYQIEIVEAIHPIKKMN